MILMTINQFSEFMSVTRQAIYNWINEGMPVEIQSPPRINQEKALEWLRKRR